jgi:hypothetical protein
MAIRKSKPVTWTPQGLSDAVSADLGFPGCMISLSNLVPDLGSKGMWQCRPAAQQLTTFAGFTSPGFISCQLVIGTRIYGMVASSRNTGRDEPFVYDIPSGVFITVTGVNLANSPASPPTSGDWIPPVMALIGGKIIVTHQGFNEAGGYFFGTLDINNPAAPAWSAGTLTGAVTLPAKPISVALYSGRAWYAVLNALVFSDTTSATNCTAGTQVITLGTNQTITAMAGTPLISQVQGGVIHSLTVFTGASIIYQITGDAALSTLALNELQVATGTYSQNSICNTPQGLCFVSPEGVRFIAPTGLVSDPIGGDGQGLNRIFDYVAVPSRVAIAYAGDVIRFNIPNNYAIGTVLYEFFYHLSRKVWSGPHTFPASLVQGYGNSFIIAPVGVSGALYRSNITPTSTDSYVEGNARMSWLMVTPLLPSASDMAMHEVIEQTISLAISSSDDYEFSLVDEQNNNLASTKLVHTTNLSLWDVAKWDMATWDGGPNVGYSTFQLAYDKPVVFKQAFFVGSGPASSAFRVGPISTRLKELGYVVPLPNVSYQHGSRASYFPGPGYNPASPGYGIGPGYAYGLGYQAGITWGLGSVPSQFVPTVSAPDTSKQEMIRAVTMIPAGTEWGYAPYEVFQELAGGVVDYIMTQNGYSAYGSADWVVEYSVGYARIGGPACDWKNSLDSLQAQLTSAKFVNLYVAWYGTDLRAGSCILVPGVTHAGLGELPHEWGCNGLNRNTAYLISTYASGAAYGGTPDDASVVAAIQDMHARGLSVAFTPFILMDVAPGNTLPKTDGAGTGQPAYPWRGRITKQFTTSDKTSQVAVEVAAFVAQYRAMILHYASLCASAGGVEVFLIGSEMRGLTWLRDAPESHPFVDALVTLAADVKAILPAAQLTYGADWTEWFGFQPADGSGDVDFHLDPLWTSPNITAIGIDNYFPLSDWRDTLPNVDGMQYASIYDAKYLMANVQGGEDYDWYYANSTDRTNQSRAAITDGAYSKPWVYRSKDMWGWWQNYHYNRPGGVESATPTAWLPQTKPIWFTEFGVPSVNKGTNQPNVFYDPKSSESAFPYFSTGVLDYAMQQAGINAVLRFFDVTDPAFVASNNPISVSYLGPMVDVSRIFVYTWDSRPFPAFPAYVGIWSDGGNYQFNQWIQGKLV